MIKFKQTARTGGDETAPYDVILDRKYMVREIIYYILTRKEWGSIRIRCVGKYEIYAEYERNKLTTNLNNNIMDSIITSIKAAGGWSNMNYLIEVEI